MVQGCLSYHRIGERLSLGVLDRHDLRHRHPIGGDGDRHWLVGCLAINDEEDSSVRGSIERTVTSRIDSPRRPPPDRVCRRVCRPDTHGRAWPVTTSVVMNIVPPPRFSYVRVKLLGGPPDSCTRCLRIQFPDANERIPRLAAAGRAVVVAVFGRGVGFCWASESPDHRIIDVVRDSSNRRRDSGIDPLQSRKRFQPRDNVREAKSVMHAPCRVSP